MKKLLYAFLALSIVCIALADDHIIRIVTHDGKHYSFRTSDVRSIRYDYHNQDSIDQAIADSIRNEFLRDSLYQDSIWKEEMRQDSIGRMHTLGYMLDSAEAYTIFAQALHLTSLFDTLNLVRIREFEKPADTRDLNGNYELYCPTKSREAYTVFAEPDSLLRANGIYSVEDLIKYANDQYGNAPEWYDYLREKGLKVSTGNDYQNEWNALHMFMAYHILKSKMAWKELVYTYNVSTRYTWNFCNGGVPYDYYETLLPRTMMKLWQPEGANYNGDADIFINRYVANNTLTDTMPEIATVSEAEYGWSYAPLGEWNGYGSEAMHTVMAAGVKVEKEDGYGYNGWYHPINAMLVYNSQVPKGVLHERMRIDFTTMLPEMNNNGFRNATSQEVSAMNGGQSGYRIAFPQDYFENLRVYDSSVCLRYNVRGVYNTWQSDALQAWNGFDVAVKMPPLPTGTYEVRLYFSPMSYGGIVEYSFGHDPNNPDSFVKLSEQDLSIPMEDPRIGWNDFLQYTIKDSVGVYDEETGEWGGFEYFYKCDFGVSSDKQMRENGYMRGPFSFTDHPENRDGGIEHNMRRGTRNGGLRKIIGTVSMTQGEDNWLRFRLNNDDGRFPLDFIEFMPTDMLNDGTYMEDWY